MSEAKVEITKSGRRVFTLELGDCDISAERARELLVILKKAIKEGGVPVFEMVPDEACKRQMELFIAETLENWPDKE